MPDISASDGAHLHYEVHGTGPVQMIFLHGMGGAATSWQLVLAELDLAAFRILVPDLRGHGKSVGGAACFTREQVTADILAVADAAGFGRFVLVSQSGSGKSAVSVALAAPERARGLVLLAPPGLGPVPLPRELLAWLFDTVAREKRIPAELDAWFTAKIGVHRDAVAREYASTPRATLDASAELWVHASIAEDAAHVTQPVLVVAGQREPVYHPDYQRQTTLTTLPRATMETLDCGHFMTFEEPPAVAEAVTRFCRELP